MEIQKEEIINKPINRYCKPSLCDLVSTPFALQLPQSQDLGETREAWGRRI